MGNGKDERKANLLASAALGAAALALGWAALELATGGILRRGRDAMDRSFEPKEVVMEDDPAVRLVEEVANEAKDKDARTQTQIEEDEIVDEGSNHTKRDKERGEPANGVASVARDLPHRIFPRGMLARDRFWQQIVSGIRVPV